MLAAMLRVSCWWKGKIFQHVLLTGQSVFQPATYIVFKPAAHGVYLYPLPTKEDYRDNSEAYRQLLELVVRSVDEASRQGVRLRSGEIVYLIPLGNKGDWPYLVTQRDQFQKVCFPPTFTLEGHDSISVCVCLCGQLFPVRQPAPTWTAATEMYQKQEVPRNPARVFVISA